MTQIYIVGGWLPVGRSSLNGFALNPYHRVMNQKMIFIFKYLDLFIALAAGFAGMGCQDSADTAPVTPPSSSSESLSVEPSGEQELGFFDTVVFTVSLKNGNGKPLADAPVEARLIGEAYNAALNPTQLSTGADGTAQVTFTAPDREVSFDIRFKSPTREVLVPIKVDSTRTGVSLDVKYDGDRAFSLIEAKLYEMSDSFSCEDPEAAVSIDALVDKKGITPTAFTFFGLRQDGSYAVHVTGKNATGKIRASGCVTDLVPSAHDAELILSNTLMNAAGIYSIQMAVDTDGAIDPLVNQLSDSIQFISNPAGAILDNLGDTLDQFAVESFVRLREDQGLDALLTEGYFTSNGIDVQAAVDPVWEMLKHNLNRFTAMGTFELETDTDTAFILHHVIHSLYFPREGNPQDLPCPILTPNQGIGAARLGGERGADDTLMLDDTLLIDEHEMTLWLGDTLLFLLREALLTQHDTKVLGESLEAIVDCASVAEFLEGSLSDVAARATLEEGCRHATMEADSELQDQVTKMNQYDSLFFKGACDLDIPLDGDAIERLIEGELIVSWGASGSDDISGMRATFEANRVPPSQSDDR